MLGVEGVNELFVPIAPRVASIQSCEHHRVDCLRVNSADPTFRVGSHEMKCAKTGASYGVFGAIRAIRCTRAPHVGFGVLEISRTIIRLEHVFVVVMQE